MEITHTLLIAIMFVTILSLSIGDMLKGFATLIDRRSEITTYAIHTGWMFLLLLILFNIFWYTIDIVSIEDWKFRDFLYFVFGPILLLCATHLLVPESNAKGDSDMKGQYFQISSQFFLLLASLQPWEIGSDFVLKKGFTVSGGFNLVGLALTLPPKTSPVEC